MLRINPFAALRPQPSQAARVASVPYDVVDRGEARELATGNPLSFLHVVRPDIDLPDGTSLYDDAMYAKARENLDRFIARGTLVRETEPCIYVYRLVTEHRAQTGVVCCCHVADYEGGLIRKHEKTRQDKEDDRTRHVLTLDANAGPVFLTYRDRPEIDELVLEAEFGRPLFHFNAPDGVTHTIWRVDDPRPFLETFRHVPHAYVADGHHRAASAARAGAERRRADGDPRGDEEYNWFLTVLFPASQLRILPYNRLVRDLGGRTPDEFLERLRALGTVDSPAEPVPGGPGRFCFYLAGSWHRLTLDPSSIDHDDPIAGLDVSLLQDRVLAPLLGIGDPRRDERIGFVGGIRGTAELEQRVDRGEAAVAVSMHPTSIDQLLAVADADRIMPPKSTWFEPKLRSGLFVHTLD